ncbi:M20/M25/M40 family metallo-hydrolase [Lactobacillus sp. Sy-1]|uniref:M20/M25/M40 family metallo-hydrolase n=1 Tax=Lactobacillus sp. Sy-1 TaxID=2109645 RepID=UPI001C5AA65F|nr:M20/M25/M40 family metallo-hydrolase [Lactobacillus sp. Sy-1]MBW1606216.1 M20/M25/M40 family metallo-hydrolase [Lactobacillus sp. Sy-1]
MKQAEQRSILETLVGINTVADNELAVAKYLADLFKKHGIKSTIVDQFPGRANLVAEIGNGNGPKLAFAGHEDTVHQGNDDDWNTPPFEASIVSDRIYGRGVTDMKSGLAAQAIALIELVESGAKINGTLRFMATISEELTQGGAHLLSEKGYVDDLDSVVIGEPTGVPVADVESYFHSGGNDTDSTTIDTLVKTQLTNQHFIVNAHKGALIYKVESFGKAAHSSTPHLGISAIDKLFEYRVAEHELFDSFTETDAELGGTIYTPDIFIGGKQVNSIPDYAYQEVMVRTIPQLSNDKLIEHLNALIDKFNQLDGFNLKLTVEFSGYPVKSDPESTIIKVAQQQAQVDLDEPLPLPLMQISMGTDGSQYKKRNPNLDLIVLGPGNNTAHRANEWVDLDSYYRFIKLYYDIASNYLK